MESWGVCLTWLECKSLQMLSHVARFYQLKGTNKQVFFFLNKECV